MEPPSITLFSSALKQYIIPVRFTAMIRSHSPSSRSVTASLPWPFPMIPATLAAPSSRPNSDTILPIHDSTSDRLETSSIDVLKLRFCEVKKEAALSSATWSTSAMQTIAPFRARLFAVASPIPEAPPVIAKTLPSRWRAGPAPFWVIRYNRDTGGL